jgi:Flp pilus assembly protein TadG
MKSCKETRNLSHRKNERGSVLAYTVLSVLFLFLAVGLGADLAHLYMVKDELQNAADAAALAGASALLLPQDQRITSATQRAVDTLNKNNYNFNSQTFEGVMPKADQASLVTFAVNLNGDYVSAQAAAANTKIRFVKVVTPTVNVNVFFSIPILGLARTMSATATSGLSVNANVFCNFVPIAVVEGAFGGGKGWLDTNGDGVKTYAGDCHPPANSPACDPNTKFCPGCKYQMIASPGKWQDAGPGNYQALDAGSGASDLKLAIAGGTTNCITSNDDATFAQDETQPGRMTGPVEKGLNTRFDIYKQSDCPPAAKCSNFGGNTVVVNGVSKPIEEAFPPDTNIYAGPGPANPKKPPANFSYPGIWYQDYLTATETPLVNFKKPTRSAVPHRREIFLPIIEQWGAGKTTVQFNKVGKFFMNKFVDDGNMAIFVEYIGPAFGSGGFDPSGGNSAPVVVPVLYQ